jgi:hypothetical protein
VVTVETVSLQAVQTETPEIITVVAVVAADALLLSVEAVALGHKDLLGLHLMLILIFLQCLNRGK